MRIIIKKCLFYWEIVHIMYLYSGLYVYLKNLDDVRRELHHGRVGDAPVDAVHEDAGADGVRHGTELGLLVGLAPRGGQLPREGGRQPLAHLGRDRVRLHLRQLVILVRQPPVGRDTHT